MKLQYWKLPKDSKWARDPTIIPAELRPSDFDQKFDFNTFIYHAFSTPTGAVLICHKLMNLEELFHGTEFVVDGIAVRASLRHFKYYDEIRVRGRNIKSLRLINACGEMLFDLCNEWFRQFAGLDTIVTVNKNNRLEWISDFVKYYVRYHNAEALLLFDNGSTEYSVKMLDDTLRNSGLKAWSVISAPFPYGPVLVDRTQLLYLQNALWNVARQDFLRQSSAVLSLDIDELVAPRSTTVFDEAKQSLLGMIRFSGCWRFTTEECDRAPPRHQDHFMRCEPDKWSPHKYCYVPGKLAARMPLENHGLSIGRWPIRKSLHAAMDRPGWCYWHCSGLTTRWKGHRAAFHSGLVEDWEARSSFEGVFQAAAMSQSSGG